MRYRGILTGCLVVATMLLVVLAGWRALHVLPYPFGTRESKKSPDGRYEASVTDWYDENFFGYSKRWFEFKVTGDSPQRIITDPIPGPLFGSRTKTDIIFWADDSSVVRFVFPATEIRMKP